LLVPLECELIIVPAFSAFSSLAHIIPNRSYIMADNETKNPHTITIIVNGVEKELDKKEELTFDEVVDLAFDPRPTGENVVFAITYRRGHGNKPEGSLVQGESVKVKDGMIFNVTATDKS
jgi:hypothetical protein